MQTSSAAFGILSAAPAGPEAGAAPADGLVSVMDRVVFLKQLQKVSNRIHSTDNLSS
jgi:hypothetical protein